MFNIITKTTNIEFTNTDKISTRTKQQFKNAERHLYINRHFPTNHLKFEEFNNTTTNNNNNKNNNNNNSNNNSNNSNNNNNNYNNN